MYQINNRKDHLMIASLNKQAYVVSRKYPFLQNFPFSEFQLKAGEFRQQSNMMSTEDASSLQVIDPNLVKFVYEHNGSSMTIVIFEEELNWINSVADKIKDLDGASVKIEDGLKNLDDILLKRDAVNFAESWCFKVQDDRARLSYSTGSEILTSLVKNPNELVSIINKIVKLSLGKGLVSLTEDEYSIILTYYQFQLIYAKLILGIVIGSKLSF
jgi:hypothetical protein